jgi:hypothetical protein
MVFRAYDELMATSATADDQLPNLVAIPCVMEVSQNMREYPLPIDARRKEALDVLHYERRRA